MERTTLTSLYKQYKSATGLFREYYATLYKMRGGMREIDSYNDIMMCFIMGIQEIEVLRQKYKTTLQELGYNDDTNLERMVVNHYKKLLEKECNLFGFHCLDHYSEGKGEYIYRLCIGDIVIGTYIVSLRPTIMTFYNIEQDIVNLKIDLEKLRGKKILEDYRGLLLKIKEEIKQV